MQLRTGIRVVFAGAMAGAFALCLAAVACSNGANDVNDCVTLESARCERAIGCGIDLNYPLHSGSSPQDAVQACQTYYQEACLHGFVTTITITAIDVGNCLKAINTGNCNAVLNPQNEPACLWLNPPDSGVDASDAIADTTVVVVIDTGTVIPDSAVDTGIQSCIDSCDSQCVGNGDCIMECEESCEEG